MGERAVGGISLILADDVKRLRAAVLARDCHRGAESHFAHVRRWRNDISARATGAPVTQVARGSGNRDAILRGGGRGLFLFQARNLRIDPRHAARGYMVWMRRNRPIRQFLSGAVFLILDE